jgi:hypothetical protein
MIKIWFNLLKNLEIIEHKSVAADTTYATVFTIWQCESCLLMKSTQHSLVSQFHFPIKKKKTILKLNSPNLSKCTRTTAPSKRKERILEITTLTIQIFHMYIRSLISMRWKLNLHYLILAIQYFQAIEAATFAKWERLPFPICNFFFPQNPNDNLIQKLHVRYLRI